MIVCKEGEDVTLLMTWLKPRFRGYQKNKKHPNIGNNSFHCKNVL